MGQWRNFEALKPWTMDGTDMSIRRALERQAEVFEDERASLLRKIREKEGELDEANVVIAELRETIEGLEETIRELEEDLQSRLERIEELELEVDLQGSPASPGSVAAHHAEEMGFLQSQVEELEATISRLNQEHDEYKETMEERLRQAERQRGQGVSNDAGRVASLEERVRGLEVDNRRVREQHDKDLAKLRALEAQLLQLQAGESSAIGRVQQLELENDRLRRERDRAREEVEKQNKQIVQAMSENRALQERIKGLQNTSHQEPTSKEVESRAQYIADAEARKMVGNYEADYAVLFHLIYEYEKEVVRLRNESLSLHTIIGMRENDVGEELSHKFAKERETLLGEIAALKMKLGDR